MYLVARARSLYCNVTAWYVMPTTDEARRAAATRELVGALSAVHSALVLAQQSSVMQVRERQLVEMALEQLPRAERALQKLLR